MCYGSLGGMYDPNEATVCLVAHCQFMPLFARCITTLHKYVSREGAASLPSSFACGNGFGASFPYERNFR
jgi:hypothetical protein